jgi:hypothetical protein
LSQENSQVLVPPRPNLGPEPWTEPQGLARSPFSIAAGLGTLVVVLLVTWLLRRRRLRHARQAPRTSTLEPSDDSPHGRIVRLAADVRQVLSAQLGPTMRARTTEELAADPLVQERLGAEQFELLIQLLSRADLWKFAPPSENGHSDSLATEIPAWEALVATLGRRQPPR